MGFFSLFTDIHQYRRNLWQACRPFWPQAALSFWHCRISHRFNCLWSSSIDGTTDYFPCHPGVVWGLSSIIGPALGGVIVDHFSWRWVFYINIPFGLLSAFLLIVSLKENVERKKHSIDYLGSLTLTIGIVALLFALLQGGVTWAWTSLPSLGLLVTLLQASSTLPYIVVAMLVIGTGLGLMSTAFIISVQNAVPWNVRGVATASTQFFRTMGGTVGVALMGTILNLQMAARFAPILAHYPAVVAHLPKNIAPSNVLLTPDVRQSLPVDFLNQLQTALAQSLFWVYALMFALAVIGLATMFLFPGGRPEQYSYKAQAEDDTQTGTIKPEPHITTIG